VQHKKNAIFVMLFILLGIIVLLFILRKRRSKLLFVTKILFFAVLSLL